MVFTMGSFCLYKYLLLILNCKINTANGLEFIAITGNQIDFSENNLSGLEASNEQKNALSTRNLLESQPSLAIVNAKYKNIWLKNKPANAEHNLLHKRRQLLNLSWLNQNHSFHQTFSPHKRASRHRFSHYKNLPWKYVTNYEKNHIGYFLIRNYTSFRDDYQIIEESSNIKNPRSRENWKKRKRSNRKQKQEGSNGETKTEKPSNLNTSQNLTHPIYSTKGETSEQAVRRPRRKRGSNSHNGCQNWCPSSHLCHSSTSGQSNAPATVITLQVRGDGMMTTKRTTHAATVASARPSVTVATTMSTPTATQRITAPGGTTQAQRAILFATNYTPSVIKFLGVESFTSTSEVVTPEVSTEVKVNWTSESNVVNVTMTSLHHDGAGLENVTSLFDVSTPPTTSMMAESDAPISDVSNTETILSKLKCNSSSLVECLVSYANFTYGPLLHNYNLMTSFYQLLEELSDMIGVSAVKNIVQDLQDYANILNINLRFCQPANSLCSLDRQTRLLETVDTFTDNVFLSEKNEPDFKEFSFTLDQLDMFMVKSVYGAIRGRTLQMKSGEITIEDIAPNQHINSSARIFVSAMIMHLPRSIVQLSDKKVENLIEAAVVSPVLSLKAYMERSKVNVVHSFSLTAKPNENDTNIPVCAFQRTNRSFTSQDVWDTEGCHVVNDSLLPVVLHDADQFPDSVRNISGAVVGCHCNHTTNFAILMQVVDVQVKELDELALSIITYIGCSVTLITQVMAITVFTCIRSLNSERVCVHRNLCITIMLAQVTFIAGVQSVDDKVVCSIVAVALHYLYTATFVWMLVEGLHLYSQVVTVFGTEKSRIIYYIVFGWGIPLVIVAISAAVDWEGYGNTRSCWLSIRRSTIWAFVGPAIAIIIVNLVILVLVLRIVITSATSSKQDSLKNVRAGIKASLFLAPLLGLTWVFGLASVNEHLVAFQYIFAILNSLQGFFIFLFHCALNTEVRQAIARMRERRSLQKGDFGSSASSSRPTSSDSRSSTGVTIAVSERWSSVMKGRNRVQPMLAEKDPMPDVLTPSEVIKTQPNDVLKAQPLSWKTHLI